MAFEVILSASGGPAEVGVKVGGQGEKTGVDLKLLNVLFHQGITPRGRLGGQKT